MTKTEYSIPTVDTWTDCYPSRWQGLIVPEAYAHPARYSRPLIQRIYQHVTALGWLQPGDTCLDPFAGPATGGLDAALSGYQYLGVELEPRFCAIAHGCDCGGDIEKHAACINDEEHGPHHITGNLELWQRRYGHLPQWVPPILLQGDSRLLTEVLASAGLSVSSPPYANGCTHTGGSDPKPQHIQGGTIHHVHYGEQPAQLGNLPSEGFEAALASPAYMNRCVNDNERTFYRHGRKNGHNEGDGAPYGATHGQLSLESPTTFWEAAAVIVSQVYAVLRPGGHAIWVTKNYIRDSAMVPFNDQWQRLCEAVGFRTLHIHHAMQVDHHEETGLFGEPVTMYHKEYKGHFRRDNERKGAPKIDYEQVLCLVKDSKEDGNGFGISIASSPYANGTVHEGSGIDPTKVQGNRPGRHSQIYAGGYGQHPAQLGNMPTGNPPRED